MLPSPTLVREVYEKHKETWTEKEKKLVHEKLNRHGINDGDDEADQAFSELMCMIYVDGIRDGKNL